MDSFQQSVLKYHSQFNKYNFSKQLNLWLHLMIPSKHQNRLTKGFDSCLNTFPLHSQMKKIWIYFFLHFMPSTNFTSNVWSHHFRLTKWEFFDFNWREDFWWIESFSILGSRRDWMSHETISLVLDFWVTKIWRWRMDVKDDNYPEGSE